MRTSPLLATDLAAVPTNLWRFAWVGGEMNATIGTRYRKSVKKSPRSDAATGDSSISSF